MPSVHRQNLVRTLEWRSLIAAVVSYDSGEPEKLQSIFYNTAILDANQITDLHFYSPPQNTFGASM
jgi:hypothetical protein